MSDKAIYRVTPSLLNNWSCPQKGAYTDIFQIGLADTSGSSAAMDIGSVFHAMAEVYYQLQLFSDFKRDVRRIEAIRYGRRAAIDYPNMSTEDVETAIRTFNDYTAYYGDDSIEILEVEQPFSRILYDDSKLTILLEGKKDLKVLLGDYKWIVDHKTSSRKPLVSPLVNQFFAYTWAENDPDVRGVIYNQVGTQKTVAPKDRFRRIPLTYTQEQLDEWHENTVKRVLEFVGYIESNSFPMNFTVCKGNFSLCQFHKICVGQPSDRGRIIATNYAHRKPHDPYAEVDG